MIPAVAAMLIGLWGITTPSFWRDESVSTLAAAMPIGDLWHLLDSIDRVHALYYLLLRPVAALSTGELAMRLPSVVATAAAAYGIAVLGRKLATPGAGLLAASLYVVLPMVSRYAQEVRSYAIVTAVAVLATWVLIEATRRSSRRWYLAYGACLVLLGWFHVYALLLVVAHVVTVLWGRASSSSLSSPSSRPDVVRFAGALAVAGAGIAPLALLAAGQRETQLSWLKPPKPSDLPWLGEQVAGNVWVALLLVALMVVGAFSGGRLTAVALPWALLPFVSMAISLVHPVYNPRYVLFAVPAMTLLAGAGLNALRPRALGWIGLVLVAALTVPTHLTIREPDTRPDNLRDMAATLLARQRPGDAVLYVDEHRRLFSAVYEDAYRNLRDLTYAPDRRTPRTAAQLTAALDGVERVWLVTGGRKHMNRAFVEDDERYLALMANRDFALRSTDDFGYSWIGLYIRKRR
ncbi:glycosyltransferase family 39 protein [Streptosporangium sp. NBC_01495]|uniref:glycosyltransferase family 39 protein n=1 Tax=Streptosporangium sp. NBC_01495 TaxID=2903899 RepID=UPI002E359963|nr:glycosyltransferase family 39 protein [Streptosporangium sp. NBC_01495]